MPVHKVNNHCECPKVCKLFFLLKTEVQMGLNDEKTLNSKSSLHCTGTVYSIQCSVHCNINNCFSIRSL